MSDTFEVPERESMEFDVVIVGAGPAGLSAAIRLKQLNPDLTVVVLEKGAEVGAHILSGAVVDPVGIDKLLPQWRDDPEHPFKTEVKKDRFLVLGPAGSVTLPNFTTPARRSVSPPATWASGVMASLGRTTLAAWRCWENMC